MSYYKRQHEPSQIVQGGLKRSAQKEFASYTSMEADLDTLRTEVNSEGREVDIGDRVRRYWLRD